MHIIIPKTTKETLEMNGWKYKPSLQLYYKKINNCSVCVQVPDDELPFECWIPNSQDVTPNDLVAIGNELKKLEANNNEQLLS
jgi:hypothetical protein